MEFKMNEKLDSYIQIRITKKEKEQLKRIAIEENTTITDLIKKALNEYMKKHLTK